MAAWDRLSPSDIARLAVPRPTGGRDRWVMVRGDIAAVVPAPIEWPVDLPEGAPDEARIAAAALSVDDMPRFGRPERALHQRGRSFWVRDATGRALARFRDEHRGDIELCFDRPFVHAGRYTPRGPRDVFLRAVSVGDEVVVAGRLHHEIDAGGLGSYREAPLVAVIEIEALFDAAAWSVREAWRALPWHRKLSLIVRNR